MINKAERIVIFGGDGHTRRAAEVLELSDKLKAPIGYAYRGKDVLEADNPNAVGMTGLLGWGGATEALGDCDLVLMLGTDFFYHAFLPAKPTIIQVDDNASHLGRRASVDLGLTGDVGETLRALLPRLTAVRRHELPRQDRQAPRQGREAPPDLRQPRGQRRGAAARDGGDRAQRPGRRRRGVHDRHRHVQRVGRPLPAHEAGRRSLASFGHGRWPTPCPRRSAPRSARPTAR